MKKVKLPACLETMGEYLLYSCSNLEQINLPKSLKSISDGAFCACEKLTEIEIPEKVTDIGDCAFEKCTQLRKINLPEGIKAIKYCTFLDCAELTSISIPANLESVDSYAFGWCEQLERVYYAGTKGDRESIQINDNNEYLENAVWYYGYDPNHICGENVSWNLTNGVLKISGVGTIDSYEKVSAQPWYNNQRILQSQTASQRLGPMLLRIVQP